MDRRNTWIVGGALMLGLLLFGLSQLWAQRYQADGRGTSAGIIGRYQVVRSSVDGVLLLDTVTGELYSASKQDIQPTSARHRGGGAGDRELRSRDGTRAEEVRPAKDAVILKDVDKGGLKNKDSKDKDLKDK
jgi:hypothetical protein